MTFRRALAPNSVAFAIGLAYLLCQTPTIGQTFNYLAFGDSITCGRGDSVECNYTSPNPLNPQTGYPGHLRTKLGCNGTNCEVYNWGKPGERTAQAKSRLPGILSGGNYDVMLLMDGTNDVFANISNTTIQTNLGLLDDMARNSGVDTVHASIVHFDPDSSSGNSQDADVANLRTKVIALASSRNRYFADPWTPLCGSQACFDAHYVNPAGAVGHPDNSGYALLATAFESVIEQNPVPVAPTAQSPNGDTASTTTTWDSVANATWYQVQWDGSPSKWRESDAACGGGSCSYTISGLAPGAHTWRVRARNPLGRSGWSATKNFNLFTSSPNVPTPISPQGDFYTNPPTEFRWSDEATDTNGASGYRLKILFEGNPLYEQDVTPACAANECSFDPGISWNEGDYSWQVRSFNLAGSSAWSANTLFSFINTVPGEPLLVYPTMDTFDTTPPFQWMDSLDADQYRIQVFNNSAVLVINELLTASTVCTGATCIYSPAVALATEAHTWRVRGINPVGAGAFSATKAFTVLACSNPVDRTISNTTVSGSTSESACETLTAETAYVVAGPNGDLELHAGIAVILGNGFTVETGGSLTCRTDP